MPKFSKKSQERLATCHTDLQSICNELIKETDFTVLCGWRSKIEQDVAFASGASKLQYPKSKHNTFPSLAIDLSPYPIDWNNHVRFRELAEKFCRIAKDKGVNVQWGGAWKKFPDMPHFELKS